MAKLPKYPALLPEDPVAAPLRRPRPPKGIATNPALCKQCNASLQLDDKFLTPKLKKSTDGEPYLDGIRYYGRGIFEHAPHSVFGGIDYARYDQIPTLPDLSLAAESGCVFCAAVRKGLQNEYQGSPWWKLHPEPLTLRIQYSWMFSGSGINLDAVVVSVFHPELGDWRNEVLRFWAYATGDEDPCTKWFGFRKGLCNNPWSPHNISMSRKWINECVDRTSLCQEETIEPYDPASMSEYDSDGWLAEESVYDSDFQDEADATTDEGRTQMSQSAEHTDGTFLPTRLLDLFPVPAHTAGCVRLVESIHLERGVRYAALSYCWGDGKPTVRTTQANLDSHQQNIKFSALPQCLRDAVTVARGLEIRYLWIDALCIIQGDGDDWARESATMWQLFQNAYVTIAAAASESFDEGFLTRRPETFHMNVWSALNRQAVGKFELSTISNPERWHIEDHPLPADLQACKWDTRGWVWQEQKLSKRLLVFGKQMIHFKCDHCMRSENGNDVHHAERPSEGCRVSWAQWLEDYTPKHFTFLQDKLPAVSGLSKQIDHNSIMRGEGPAQYLAGIWYCSETRRPQKGWQQQLFWGLDTPRQSFQEMLERLKCTDPRTYTAPSWSWASRGEGVRWYMHGSEARADHIGVCPSRFAAKIEDHQMNLTGPDPTGRVGPGSYLKLSGIMHPDPLDLSACEGFACFDYSAGSDWTIVQNPQTRQKPRNRSQSPEKLYIDISLDWNHSPTDQEYPSLECDIRQFGLWRSRYYVRRNYTDYLHGLLLLRDRESGLYLRVGSFRTSSSDSDGKELYRPWKRQSIYIL